MHRIITALIATAAPALAVNIIVDYNYDLGYFQGGSAARATIEAAASDIGMNLKSGQLAAITNRTATGTALFNNGTFDLDTTINLSAAYTILNPSTSDTVRLSQETWAADEFRLYVGMDQFNPSSDKARGVGANVSITTLGFGYEPSWQAALDLAVLDAAKFQRGDINIFNYSGALPSPGETVTGEFTLGIGPTAGSLWFDADANWQLDHTDEVGEAQFDLYSFAIQEIMRSMGVTSEKNIVAGQRYEIDEADLLAFRNAGWQTTTNIPEPGTTLLSVAGLTLFLRRKRP